MEQLSALTGEDEFCRTPSPPLRGKGQPWSDEEVGTARAIYRANSTTLSLAGQDRAVGAAIGRSSYACSRWRRRWLPALSETKTRPTGMRIDGDPAVTDKTVSPKNQDS